MLNTWGPLNQWLAESSSEAVISFTMPQMSVSAEVFNETPVVSSAVAITMPQMAVSVNMVPLIVGTAAVLFRMPQMQIDAECRQRLGGVIGTYNQPTGSPSLYKVQ